MNNNNLRGNFFLILFFLFTVSFSYAQTSTLSPYSRFGVGDLLFNGYSSERGMAGVSIAEASPVKLNFNNPASYAYDTLMVVDFGITTEWLYLKQGSNSSTQWNSNVYNFSLGFPLIRNKWGMAFGFIPYSGSGYNIESQVPYNTDQTATYKFTGDGGYTRYYIGSGIKISPRISAGVNANYLFGTINHTRNVSFNDPKYFNNLYTEELTLSDVYLEFGLNWKGKIKDKYDFSIGLTGAPAQKENAKKSTLWQNYFLNTYTLSFNPRDTIYYSSDLKGNVILPLKMGLGFQISEHNNWRIGMDFNWQNWSDYQSFDVKDSLHNSFSIALGGEIVPDAKSLQYIERMQYRAGIIFRKTYLEFRNTSLNEMGLSLGFGLPLRRATGGLPVYASKLNFAIEGGIRGTTNDNLVKEQYLRLVFGVTLNEDWFRKTRFY